MLRHVDEVKPGDVVYLYPHTRTAGQYAWLRLPAVVVEVKRYWPRVKVEVECQGKQIETLVHKDDIKLRPDWSAKQEKRDGDMANSDRPEVGTSRRLALTTAKVAQIEGQLDLF